MDQSNNLGSFGAATGGLSPELQAAIQSRAGGVPASSQVTNSAPTANPETQAPNPMTGAPPMPQQTASASAPQPNLPFDASEAKIILSAMGTRLKALSKLAGA